MFGKPEEHFFKYGLSRGKISFRGHSQPVRMVHLCNMSFKLRALLGTTARSEIVLYLLDQ